VIALAALIGVWGERKVAGRIQMRIGPQELGPFGLLQTLADTVKLVLKEDITPGAADVRVFRAMPLIVFVRSRCRSRSSRTHRAWAPLDTGRRNPVLHGSPGDLGDRRPAGRLVLAQHLREHRRSSCRRADDLLRAAAHALGPAARVAGRIDAPARHHG
jgi:hypothetical protein